MSEQDPFSSTGHLGIAEPRSDERYYLNANEFFNDPAQLTEAWDKLQSEASAYHETVDRIVLRGIVSDAVLEALRTGPHAGLLEAAVPLGDELGRPDNNLVYLGHNDEHRQPLASVQEIITGSSDTTHNPGEAPNLEKAPVENVRDILRAGSIIKTTVSPEDYEGLHELWGERFGWKREQGNDQIAEFGHELEAEHVISPQARKKWFAGIHKDGKLVAAAMGERLSMQGSHGPIDLVESTEWSVHNDHAGNGYGPAVIAALNAQILHDLHGSPVGRPLIFAECNFKNRADMAGAKAGMAIPSREHANQVLPQNVSVFDGEKPEGLRDFNLMVLPLDAEQAYYRPKQTEEMLNMIKSGQTQ